MADGFDGEIRLGVKLTPTDVKKTASQLQQEIEKIFNTSAGQKTSKQFQQMEIQLDGLYNKSQKLQESLKQMEATRIPTEEYKEITKQIADAEKKLAAFRAAEEKASEIGKPLKGERLRAMQYEVAQLENTIEYAKGELQDLVETGKAFTLGSDTQEYKNTANQLNGVNNEIVKTISATEALQQQEEELPEPVQRTSQAAEQLKSAMSRVGNLISKVLHGLGNMTKALGGKIVSATKKLVGQFSKLGHHSDKHQLSLKKMARMMLKYGLGIRSVFLLWRKLRSYATEAIKTMAQNFEEVDADVSMLMNSFNQMKNSFGTMAQPLLHALAPALNYIISLITSAMNALANFFAIITGQKYIYKATKQNKSYAESLGGVGGAAKDANKELAEYDNLLVIKSQEEGSGGGGGGAADGLTGTFEKTLAESDFAKQLKDAINRGDWEGVGGLFANKLNIITKTFDNWINKKFRPKAVTWASRIGRILNGLTEGWDSNLTGKTVADTLNAILDTANTFFKTYKFKRLGEKVGGLIKGFFDNMDPVLLGETLANKINAVIDFATGLIDTTPWAEIGDKLGTALKTWFETVKWEDLGADLQKLASGILTSLSHFIESSNLGVTVGTAINKFLSKIDFKQLGEDLSDCAKSIIGAIADLIKTIDWYEVGKAIADLLTNIDWIGLAVELGKVALALIKGLAEALLGLASNPKVVLTIAEALLAIFAAKKIWSMLTGMFSTNIGSALSSGIGLAKVAVAAGTWELAGRGAGKLFEGIASALGEEELAKEYGEFAKGPTKYLVNAISTGVDAAKEYSETTGRSTLSNAVHMLFGEDVTGMANANAKNALDAANEQSKRSKYQFEILGHAISDEEWEKFKNSCDDYVAEIDRLYEAQQKGTKGMSDYAEKYKQAAQDTQTGTDTAKQAHIELIESLDKSDKRMMEFAESYCGETDKFMEEYEKYVATIEDGNEAITTSTETMNNQMSDYSDKYKESIYGMTDYSEKYKNEAPADIEEGNKDIEQSFYNMTSYVPPAVKEAMEQASSDMVTSFDEVPNELGTTSQSALQSIASPFDQTKEIFENRASDMVGAFDSVPADLGNTSQSALESVKNNFTQDALTGHFTSVKDNIETPFKELPSFFSDTFKESWNEAESAFSDGNTTFNNFNAKLSEGMTNTINGLIGGLNSAVSGPLQKIQEVINKFKNVKIGASSLFSNLPSFSNIPSIPMLAQGAVIPPNREFLAMLGDQTSGTNIETPLETMVQAFKTALSEMGGSSNNQNIVLQLDGRTVAQCVWDEEDKRYKQTGRR